MKWIAITSALALTWVASASAAPFGPVEEAAWQQAEIFWGRAPDLCTSITKEVVPYGGTQTHAASPDEPEPTGEATQPQGQPVPCVIRIVETDPWQVCPTMVHEYGHLLGYGHPVPYPPGVACPETIKHLAWEQWYQHREGCHEDKPGSYWRQTCFVKLRAWAERIRDIGT